ncbi:MAG TPA: tryptophan synthase subunit alpha [Thermoclostridium caenicola]|uniref:Tryptophan synthase alpha chain n=1 Tax=Thermoclostridium caenicola TaxID=659425 RepID=A0A1M6CFV1_9FIRM|nr:tryptophan synthase subunit alpha [Thermoclostridium caenicola]SHI59624.1 tryptophan synthase, alpha chain [Thermoclostridium caenicola]HOK43281.1 tryptophan synthase subunit alpha [Thermoclostridium caenicola]HOL85397.1 tryptophan synthase subunit alpha [Thermoclostridium caenicola]HPO77580.1 tryptophan synthase subunit alpha [Thermoclostridium caenicola]
MNRMEQVFKNGKAFIPFITAGDPDIETTERLVHGMAEAGADLIELGIPFSDPVAEGPVIQAASSRALAGGVTTDSIFAMVRRIRKTCQVPIAFMTYINPVFSYGYDRFLENCEEAGVDALIIPDLPFEERGEILPFCRKYGIMLVPLVSPTSGSRIETIAREAQGFIYCVSSMGVTGVREHIGNEAEEMVNRIRKVTDVPCAIGFGISTPEQASRMAAFADGVIVGSAIVRMVEQYGADCVPHVVEYVRMMKHAVSDIY